MSEGKFSQPRPHRDEERQIEESFRLLTEEPRRRRKKVYNVEEDIQKTVQEISAQEVSLPEDNGLPFEKSAKLDQTVLAAPGQTVPPRRNTAAVPRQNPVPAPPVKPEQYDLLSEDMDSYFEQQAQAPAEPVIEEEPDFIDKLMNLADFFKKHQTPVILGLCGAALLLIVVFISMFFTGSADPYENVIFPNVLIADVNIGGMTRKEAISALEKATAGTYSREDMVIDLSGTEIRLSPADTKASLDAKAAVEAAFEYGRTGTQAQREQAYQQALEEEHVIAALPYLRLDLKYIQNTLQAYAEDTGSTLTQTSYGLEGPEPELSADKFSENAPTQTLIIVMGTPGIGFDVNDVYEKVLDAYSLHNFTVHVENVHSVSEPEELDLDAVYEEFYIEPVNASVNMQNFKTEAGSYGYDFDLKEAQKLVDAAQPGEVLRIPMRYIAPDILDNDSFFRDILGEHQTRSTGNSSRNSNLLLACEAIHDTVLNPGETLSFSNAISKVRGFKTAPEDTGREETEQGGVTQVASTLYYAALMSDLNISSRSNHSYLPSYIDYGLDATADLKISNSTGYPIRIEAEYTGGYVKIKILGTEERDYYIMLESSIANTTQPKTVYEEYSFDNDEGYEDGDVIEEGTTGYLVKSYTVKYNRQTGKELSRDFITNSQYKATDRIVARVEQPVETEPPTVPPTTIPPATTVPTEPPETTEAPQPSTEPPEMTESTESPATEQDPASENFLQELEDDEE